MDLNERKWKILNAIINNYFETALPVGSRTLSKLSDLGVSPATIRNEMSDLEDLGFIVQPHTSAGRIPSDKGYRLYVDMMMQLQKAEFTKLVYLEELKKSMGRVEDMLQNIGKQLADETHYATIVSSPKYKETRIKNVQLVEVEPTKVLLVLVTDTNVVKDNVIQLQEAIEQKVLNDLAIKLNEELYNKSLKEINLDLIQRVKGNDPKGEETAGKVVDSLFNLIGSIDNMDIYTYGATNMLSLPEFNDIKKAKTLMEMLEKKDLLEDIVNTTIESEDGNVKIVIGEENDMDGLKDCSLITTSYHIDGEKVGAIGIIGPKRMDYYKTVANLRCLIKNVDDMLNKFN